MRLRLLLLFFLLALAGVGRAQQLEDTFSDGDITHNPAWAGTLGEFYVDPSGWLNLTAHQAGQAWLSTPLALRDSAVWEVALWCGLSPSSANYSRIVLAADAADMSGAYTGWQLSVGQSGSQDGLDLYRVTGGRRRLVRSFGAGGFDHPFLARIKVSCGPGGGWQVWADTAARGPVWLGQARDTAGLAGSYVGLEAVCTSSFTNFYWHWDDVRVWQGPPNAENASPDRLLRAACAGRRLFVEAGRGVQPGPAAEATVDGQPVSIVLTRQADGRYSGLADALPALPDAEGVRRFSLALSGWVDSLGRAVPEQAFPCRCLPEAARLALSEVKAGAGGPEGQPALPEFIEVHNPAPHAVWLEAPEVEDASATRRALPADSLAGDGYRVYANPAGLAALRAAGAADAQGAALPSLNDDGDRIRLGLGGVWVDSLAYTTGFWARREDVTAFSLELGPPCLPNGGWYPSRAALGATPAAAPAYDWATDTTLAPRLVAAEYATGQGLRLHLRPAPSPGAALDPATFSSDPPLPGGRLVWQDSVLVYADGPAPDSTRAYRFTLTGLAGCGGAMQASNFLFRQPIWPDSGGLVLNELLYDPLPGGRSFVELLNTTDRWISLGGVGIASLRDPWADTVWLPAATPPLEPGGYRWLAQEARAVSQAYPKAVATAYLPLRIPPVETDGGTLLLLDPAGNRIDGLAYGPDLHSPGVAETEGVSLERVSGRLPAAAPGNWQSCAAQPPATPGYLNSQSLPDAPAGGDGLVAEPPAFSPDADGYQDVTALSAPSLPPGTVGRVTIFDPGGTLIRRLSPQSLTGPALLAVWDGRTDAGSRAGAGLYLVLAEFYHPSQTIAPRKVVVGIKP